MTDAVESPADLAALAQTANVEHAAYEVTQAAAVAHAIAAGDALIEAKRIVGHGGWLAWVAANLDFSDRTARVYMTLARNRQRAADLPSIRAALAGMAKARPKPKASMWDEWVRTRPRGITTPDCEAVDPLPFDPELLLDCAAQDVFIAARWLRSAALRNLYGQGDTWARLAADLMSSGERIEQARYGDRPGTEL